MISITKAEPKDIPILCSIGRQTLLESHGHSAPQHVMLEYVDDKFSETFLTNELNDSDNIFHLIHYNNQPVGYSKIIYNIPIENMAAKNITKMERLYVLQEFHSLKPGHELMQFNIELSKQNGQAGMWLYTWKENYRAINFYKRVGFVIVGDGFFRLTATHSNPNWQMFLQY